jgi:hypothetical protein
VSAQNAGTDCNPTVLGGNKKFWSNTYGYCFSFRKKRQMP